MGRRDPFFFQKSQASDTTVDSCSGSTRVHRGRVSTLMWKNASLTAQVSGPERAVGKVASDDISFSSENMSLDLDEM